MSDIEQIARSMMTDFMGAVAATEKARRQQIANIMDLKSDALEKRRIGESEVRRMQEEAMRIVAESLRLGEKIVSQFDDDMRHVEAALNDLRGPAVIAGRTQAALGNG